MKLASALVLCLTFAGCGGSAGPISLSPEWPSQPPDLDDASRAWTREGSLITSITEGRTMIARLHATFESPQWRAAKVARARRRGQLSAAEVQGRLDAEKQEAAKEHDFYLLLATHDARANDLSKGDRSMWTVRLRDDKGNSVAPISIKKDRRPREEIKSELPQLSGFDQVYVARFPASLKILGPDARSFSLVMWSGLGTMKLVWKAGAD